MSKSQSVKRVILALAAMAAGATLAAAGTITLDVDPTMIPDETAPRVEAGNPTGFASDSWKAPATGKSNFHLRYLLDDNYLTYLFPADAATMTVNDLDEVSYFTKGNPAGKDWWIQIYTRPTGSGDCRSWYHERWTSNYTSHSAQANWTNYTTADGSILFSRDAVGMSGPYGCPGNGTAPMTLAAMQAMSGTQLIEMISVHTDSGWSLADPARDSQLDGLVVRHVNGNVGRVNFGNTFLPASSGWTLGLLTAALAIALAAYSTRKLHAQA